MRIRRTPATIAAVVLACGALAATALAFSTGGTQIQMINQESAVAASTSALVWTDLAPSAVSVTVPTNSTRLINARFTAESGCAGPNAGRCLARIIAVNAGGGFVELSPITADFMFDTDVAGLTDDGSEGNAMERSRRLPAGTWRIVVQRMVTNATTSFVVDDWHHAVEVSA
jgi:hypothetical protein